MSGINPKVMIIEDETLLLKAICKKLNLNHFETISCTSGKQALDYLSNLTELPDAIWLDYYLKDTNGLDFMQELKKNKKWENIPVIVVSNSASPEKVHSMLALGAKKYLLKSQYRLEDVMNIIREFIDEGNGGKQLE